MTNCPLCDKQAPEGANFCPNCGWPLAEQPDGGRQGAREETEEREDQ